MGLRFLEHILILTPDPDATRDWFCTNLGLTVGPHPDFGFPVHWLYIGTQDVLHIGLAGGSAHQRRYLGLSGAAGDVGGAAASGAPGVPNVPGAAPPPPALGSGRIDHVCFHCEGLVEMVERLRCNGVEFIERKAHGSGLWQLFMREPVNGIRVELNFSAEEALAAGRVAGWTDAGEARPPAAAPQMISK